MDPLPRPWLDLHLGRLDGDVEVKPTWNGREIPRPHRLGPAIAAEIPAFAAGVAAAAARGDPIKGDLLEQAKRLHGALFSAGAKLPAGKPLLVRLFTSDAELRTVPWEALCDPSSERRFLGSSPTVLFARGAYSHAPCAAWPVPGAVHVLAISPRGDAPAEAIRTALDDRIKAGEMRWFPPVVKAAREEYILDSLSQHEDLNVLHFVGHGGLRGDTPVLFLGEDDDGPGLLYVDRLAEELEGRFRQGLRLVVLESCEGARPGSFASAAEMLATGGADAVIANLWTVDAREAASFSQGLYGRLAGGKQPWGDIARAVNGARRRLLVAHEDSAAAFAPVLYLRGPESVLFEYDSNRQLRPPADIPIVVGGLDRLQRDQLKLNTLLRRPAGFSLLIGDARHDDRSLVDAFQQRLEDWLAQRLNPPPPGLPLPAIAQRFFLETGEQRLLDEFHSIFNTSAARQPLLEMLAGHLAPGVHVTLLRLPLLEATIAQVHPDVDIYVIRPPAPGEEPPAPSEEPASTSGGRASPSTFLLHRKKKADTPQRWERLYSEPEIDPAVDFVILRMYRGYLPQEEGERARYPPLLTEDDYLRGVRDLDRVVSPDLANAIRARLTLRPMFLFGLSALAWQHRMLLHRLLGVRQVPAGSVVALEPAEDGERSMWATGAFLPGKVGVGVVSASADQLLAWLRAAPVM